MQYSCAGQNLAVFTRYPDGVLFIIIVLRAVFYYIWRTVYPLKDSSCYLLPPVH